MLRKLVIRLQCWASLRAERLQATRRAMVLDQTPTDQTGLTVAQAVAWREAALYALILLETTGLATGNPRIDGRQAWQLGARLFRLHESSQPRTRKVGGL